jgi:hypothetical protein
MAERKKNVYSRQLISFNPNFRIDTSNPQMGKTGEDVYKLYGVTDNGETQSSISLSSAGSFEIYNDRTITICGGTDNNGKEEDIIIIGKNGNVSISANGMVRIRATSIMFEADEDIQFKAGRNVDIKSGSGRTLLQGTQLDLDAPLGSLMDELGQGFLQQVFAGSFVGADVITGAVGGSGLLSGVAGVVLNKVVSEVT